MKTSGSQDLFKICPTSTKYAVGDVVYDGMIVGVNDNSSSTALCSGLGTCSQQKCTCVIATQGLYANLQMIRGNDCADVSEFAVYD